MIKYPQMRNELIINIRALGDPVYQRRVWVNLERPLAHYEDNFASVIHFIFDDMSLDTHLKQAIGDILHDESEAEALKKVVEAINKVLDSSSSNTTDQEYIESLFWLEVISAAQKAYEILTKGQRPEGMFEDIKNNWLSNFRNDC